MLGFLILSQIYFSKLVKINASGYCKEYSWLWYYGSIRYAEIL